MSPTGFWIKPKQFGPDNHKTGAAHQEWFVHKLHEGQRVDTGIILISDRQFADGEFSRRYVRNGKEFGEDFKAALKDWEDNLPNEGLKVVSED